MNFIRWNERLSRRNGLKFYSVKFWRIMIIFYKNFGMCSVLHYSVSKICAQFCVNLNFCFTEIEQCDDRRPTSSWAPNWPQLSTAILRRALRIVIEFKKLIFYFVSTFIIVAVRLCLISVSHWTLFLGQRFRSNQTIKWWCCSCVCVLFYFGQASWFVEIKFVR